MTVDHSFAMPEWAKPFASTKIMSLLKGVFENEICVTVTYMQTPLWKQLREDFRYIIISLRKCSHGGPLLPCSFPPTSEGTWEQCSTHGKKRIVLPSYLKELFRRLDIKGVSVHGCLDGQALAPYQAAIQQASWAQAWVRLEQPYKAQRAAYRLLFGGSSAPELKVGLEPRFVQGDVESGSDGASLGHVLSGEISGKVGTDSPRGCQDVPVRGTFVHFDWRSRPSFRRCGSQPPSTLETFELLAH